MVVCSIHVSETVFIVHDVVYPQDYAVQYWISGGFPSTKISLGIPLYGKAWTFSGNTAVRSAATGAAPAGPIVQQSGTLGYIEVGVCTGLIYNQSLYWPILSMCCKVKSIGI